MGDNWPNLVNSLAISCRNIARMVRTLANNAQILRNGGRHDNTGGAVIRLLKGERWKHNERESTTWCATTFFALYACILQLIFRFYALFLKCSTLRSWAKVPTFLLFYDTSDLIQSLSNVQVKLQTKGDQTLFSYRRSLGPFPARICLFSSGDSLAVISLHKSLWW